MPWRHMTYVMRWHIVMSHVMSSWYFVVQVKYFMFYSVFHNSRAFKCVDANFVFLKKKWHHFDTSWRHDAKSQKVKTSTMKKTYSGKVTKGVLAAGRVVWVIGKNVLWGVIFPRPLGRRRVKNAKLKDYDVICSTWSFIAVIHEYIGAKCLLIFREVRYVLCSWCNVRYLPNSFILMLLQKF